MPIDTNTFVESSGKQEVGLPEHGDEEDADDFSKQYADNAIERQFSDYHMFLTLKGRRATQFRFATNVEEQITCTQTIIQILRQYGKTSREEKHNPTLSTGL